MKLRIWSTGVAFFMCPGCNAAHRVNVSPSKERVVWGYNGNADRPTLTPSVLTWWTGDDDGKKVEERCHSFVTDGRIRFLGDCTHALAGQTVDLPEWKADPVYEESAP